MCDLGVLKVRVKICTIKSCTIKSCGTRLYGLDEMDMSFIIILQLSLSGFCVILKTGHEPHLDNLTILSQRQESGIY